MAPGLVIPRQPHGGGFPMAITSDGRKVLLCFSQGDLRTLVSAPRTGNAAPETWLNFTQAMWYLDVGPDGSLYMDQLLQRPEALTFRGRRRTPGTAAARDCDGSGGGTRGRSLAGLRRVWG